MKGHTRSSPVLQQRTPETLDSHGKQIKTGSPGSEVVTLQQFLEESNKSTSSEVSLKNILTMYYPIYRHRINRQLLVSRIALKLCGDTGYACIKKQCGLHPDKLYFTESQNGRGWKGPLWVI